MPSTFPAAETTLTDPTSGQSMEDPALYHDVLHALINDCIRKLEVAVGKTGATLATSIEYRVAKLEQTGLFYVDGPTPVGVVTAKRPAFCYNADTVWKHTSATPNNTSWVLLLEP